MKVDNQIVIFENADMHFIKKYGIQVATDMVLNYTAVNNTPFIHDFYQLASFLCMKPSWIRKVLEDIASNYVHLEIPKNPEAREISIIQSDGLHICKRKYIKESSAVFARRLMLQPIAAEHI